MSPKNLKNRRVLLVISICLSIGYVINTRLTPAVLEITPAELAQLMHNKPQALVLIDVRTPDEYTLEHIPAAFSIPLADVPTNIPRIQKLAQKQRVITYCATGFRSYKALDILKNHHIVGTNLTGGFDAWWAFTHTLDP